MKLSLAALMLIVSASLSAACGTPSSLCKIDSGAYRVALPETVTPDTPLMVFLHGYGGSSKGTMGNRRLVAPMLARGWAVVAPEGLPRGGDGPRSWTFFPGWEGRDEAKFLRAVADDAAAQFGLNRAKTVLSGFSAGGFMVNYLACAEPASFAAYAPVAGGFWRPHPTKCAGPVKLLHTHGWVDPTVPLEGRKLRGGAFQQGDIFAGLEIWRSANGCSDEKPSSYNQTGPFLRRSWKTCAPDSALEFALWPGGHTLPDGWADMVVDWYEAVVEPN